MKIKPLKLNDTEPLATADLRYQLVQQLYAPVEAISQSDSNLLCFIYEIACETLYYPQASAMITH